MNPQNKQSTRRRGPIKFDELMRRMQGALRMPTSAAKRSSKAPINKFAITMDVTTLSTIPEEISPMMPLGASSRWSLPSPTLPATAVLDATDEQALAFPNDQLSRRPSLPSIFNGTDEMRAGEMRADVMTGRSVITTMTKPDSNSHINDLAFEPDVPGQTINRESYRESCTSSTTTSTSTSTSTFKSHRSLRDRTSPWAPGVLHVKGLELSSSVQEASALEQLAMVKARAHDLVTLLAQLEAKMQAEAQERMEFEARLLRKLDIELEISEAGVRQEVTDDSHIREAEGADSSRTAETIILYDATRRVKSYDGDVTKDLDARRNTFGIAVDSSEFYSYGSWSPTSGDKPESKSEFNIHSRIQELGERLRQERAMRIAAETSNCRHGV